MDFNQKNFKSRRFCKIKWYIYEKSLYSGAFYILRKGCWRNGKAAEQHIYEMYSQGYCIHLVAPKTKIVGDIPSFIKHIDVSWPVWDKYKIFNDHGQHILFGVRE